MFGLWQSETPEQTKARETKAKAEAKARETKAKAEAKARETKAKEEALLNAARDGNLATVISSLNDGVNIECYNINGSTPLHRAALCGRLEIVRFLLEKGAKIEAKNDYLDTPLHDASLNNKVEVVRLLLAYGANVDATNFWNQTPLVDAQEKGFVQVQEPLRTAMLAKALREKRILDANSLLRQEKIIVNHQEPDGTTLLHLVLAMQDLKLLATMLEKSNLEIDATDSSGRTALAIALATRNIEATYALLQSNAQLDAVDKSILGAHMHTVEAVLRHAASTNNNEMVAELLQHGASPAATNENGETALHFAAANGHTAIVQTLLENDKSLLGLCDQSGNTALHVAAEKAKKGHVDAVNKVDKTTMLMAAATNNHESVVNVLLSYLVSTLILDDASYKALTTHRKELVAAQGYLDQRNAMRKTTAEIASNAAKQLIENSVTSLQTNLDRTRLAMQSKKAALSKAMKTQEWPMVKRLLLEGVPVTSLDFPGAIVNANDAELRHILVRAIVEADDSVLFQTFLRTLELSKTARNQLAQVALVLAVTSVKTLFVMNLLRMADVNLDLVTTEGPSPLHLAAKIGSVLMLSMLLTASRADVDTINEGFTALANAVREGHIDAAKVLLSASANPSFVLPSGHTILVMAVRRGHQELAQLLYDSIYTIIPTVTSAAFSPLERLPNGGFGAIEKVAWKNKSNDDIVIRKRPLQAGRCRSPYLLPALAIVDNPTDGVQLVTEWMRQGDLFHYLKRLRTPLPNDGIALDTFELSIVHVAWVIANGLAYLHAKNIIHRDLKSSNVFLCAKHGVVLGDFGIARAIEKEMTAGAGTDVWMAPEVLREENEEVRVYDASADIYSFGVILTELDTGHKPFADSPLKPFEILNRVRLGTLRPAMTDNSADGQ
ncbi:TKL protein kinase [Saprolegnia diclina VS20]|uniref:TKL protein kinase n=1 Tax=Saprolegnia diclina (strain VS20) TaxID=1156394 RepID=T0PZY5_SAPDV|nr:TKL protein kinase [Saprolegnia diclina VS20]EQC26670.1 TKL protein kinase [Saprolegnia diclina VS20]|eukprot:XP_008619905.1 TKL protein kinase [Saprolegnia diclina VS20]